MERNEYVSEGIRLLQARQKRAVIPIVGKALSDLFSTVSEENVKTIRWKLRDVEKKSDISSGSFRELIDIECHEDRVGQE